MTLYLVRHGKAAAGIDHADPGLDALGHAQAEAVARALAACGAERLVVSPLRRTRETAEPIAAVLRLQPELDARVGEVLDPSWTAEARLPAIRTLLGACWSQQSANLAAWRERVLETFLEIAAGSRNVVVVSHYVAISAAIGRALGVDAVAPGLLPNASVTRFDLRDGSLALIEAANVTHLSPDEVTGGLTGLAGS
jgi:broad specificity phosphatase PhoE